MNHLDEYENLILDEFRRRDVRAGRGLAENLLLNISPPDRRDAAVESLITKGILTRNKVRLILTDAGELAIYT